MAYDTLKAEIRQYIKTNGANEITGQILQNVLLDMVNAYPSLDGYATQQWVQNQLGDMATMTWVGQNFVQNSALNNYLPLSGGTLTGFIGAGTLSTGSYSLGNTGLDFSYSSNGSPRYAHAIRISSVDGTITFIGRGGALTGTVIDGDKITSGKFIVSNGTSSQFLKADGSVDNTSYLPLTGGMINGNLSVFNNLYVGSRLSISAEGGTPEDPESYEFWLDNGEINIDNQTVITRTNITANAFVKNNGTSAQFLKADGSVDSNTYLTTAILSGYATETWVGNNYLALSGGTITGNTELDGNLVVNGTLDAYNDIILKPASNESRHLKIYSTVSDYADIYADGNGLNIDASNSNDQLYLTASTVSCNNDLEVSGDVTVDTILYVHDICYLGGTSAQNAIVNIADSAQIVQTNQSYKPYLLFHKPNVNRTRLAMADDGTIEVRAGETGTAFRKFACGRINVDGGSDGYGYISIDSDGINIDGSNTDADKVYLNASLIYCSSRTDIDGDCHADSFIQNSDVRLKNIISDINLNIYNVANAPIFKYTWKDGKYNQALHVGTSAQYWQTVLPETVSEKKDGMLAMQYDVVALAGVTTVAKVVVDHEQRIAELEKENALLKAKLNIN